MKSATKSDFSHPPEVQQIKVIQGKKEKRKENECCFPDLPDVFPLVNCFSFHELAVRYIHSWIGNIKC